MLAACTAVRADFKDDIGYNQLKAEYGSSLPDGSGVRMAQIEYLRYGVWAPEAAGELAGKSFTYVTNTFGGFSSHGNEVGAYLGGSSTSITPNLPGWACFEATNYCGAQSLYGGRSFAPLTATWDIENHSWGGTDAFNALANLRRMDFRVERDNVISVVGVDNGGTMSHMFANAYNVIAVGSSTGDHPHSGSTLDTAGRTKPELVGTATWTSYATPIVASCAALMVGEINRTPSLGDARSPLAIKALLMAGATKSEFPGWTNSPSNPLDSYWGAGEVNIYNTYKALVAGRQQPVYGTSLSASGWDVNTTSRGSRRLYFITVQSGQSLSLSTVLTWYRHVDPSASWYSPASTVHNLDLVLWRADASFNLTGKVTESVSSIGNVEHIYQTQLGAGVYALEVTAPLDGEKYALAWSGVLSGTPSNPGSVPPPPAPPPPAPNPEPPPATGLADASFETHSVGSGSFYAFAYNPGGGAWRFSARSGVSGNGSGFTSQNPGAPSGGQVAFIQADGTLEQSFSLGAGTYQLTAQVAQRGIYQQMNQTVDAYVDGQPIGTLTTGGTGYAQVASNSFTVSDGSHTLTMVGRAPGDGTLFIDALSIGAAAANPWGGGSGTGSIADSSFESPAVGGGHGGAYRYNPAGTGWTFSPRSGVTGNGSDFTAWNPSAPAGSQVAFIQMDGAIEQAVSMAAGTYRIAAKAAQRVIYQSMPQTVDVFVDGSKVGTLAPSGGAYQDLSTGTFAVAAGQHTVRFVGRAAGDGTLLLDAVTLQDATAGAPALAGGSVTVAGAGFESPNVGTGAFEAFAYRPAGSGWTFSGGGGVAGNGSGFTQGNPAAPQGTQVAFLQGSDAVMAQTLTVARDGAHSLVVTAACRGLWNQAVQKVDVYLDNQCIGSIAPSNTSYDDFTLGFNATAGAHTLTFKGTVAADATALIDDVVVLSF